MEVFVLSIFCSIHPLRSVQRIWINHETWKRLRTVAERIYLRVGYESVTFYHAIHDLPHGIIYKFLFFRKAEIKISFTWACWDTLMVVIVVCQQAIFSVGPIKASNDKAQSVKKFSTPLSNKSSMIYAFSTLSRKSSRKSYAWWHSKCHLKRKNMWSACWWKWRDVNRREASWYWMTLWRACSRKVTLIVTGKNQIGIHRSFDRNFIHFFILLPEHRC